MEKFLRTQIFDKDPNSSTASRNGLTGIEHQGFRFVSADLEKKFS